MTDSQPERPAADDPRARRAAARAARQAAADQRRSDRAVARSLAMSKRQAAVARADGEPQNAEPGPAVVEEAVVETIVNEHPERQIDQTASFAEKLAVARQAAQHQPEAVGDGSGGPAPQVSKRQSTGVDESSVGPVNDETPSDELSGEPQRPDAAKQLRDHARAVAKARRAEGREKLRTAKAQSRAEAAAFKEARAAKSSARGAQRDRIVEAPREPKKSFAERLRRDPSSRGGAPKMSAGRRVMSIVAGLLGLVGMTCSVILAVGALLVALRADGSGFYDTITDICDVLVGPLRDVVSFSGTNAAMKEALVAWGAGSIIYLVMGLLAQSFLRPAAED